MSYLVIEEFFPQFLVLFVYVLQLHLKAVIIGHQIIDSLALKRHTYISENNEKGGQPPLLQGDSVVSQLALERRL